MARALSGTAPLLSISISSARVMRSYSAGAAPLAAVLKEKEQMAGRKVGLILSGGNADPALIQRVLLRAAA